MEPLDREITRALNEPELPVSRGPAHILIIGGDDRCETTLVPALQARDHQCTALRRAGEAKAAIGRKVYDVILLGLRLPDGSGLDLLPMIARATPSTRVIAIDADADLDVVLTAIRGGAVDFVHTSECGEHEFVERVETALHKSRLEQHREQRLARLKRICEELNSARRDVTEQVDGLCNDLTVAYRDIADQMSEVAMATEFRTLIRQELDVEDLLRTKLEYMLTKTGATNAAVFLPDQFKNFGLGAYVNYDCPRESVASLLDHLCHAICPQMAEETDLVLFDDADEFAEWIGAEAGILGDSQVIAFSCRHHDECLAVVVLFRSRTDPFDEQLAATVDVLRPIFAEQLANIIRIHHRAEPQWPDDPVDEPDFNDEYGFGYGDGLAA
jgi:FixJ family two-component response regulator